MAKQAKAFRSFQFFTESAKARQLWRLCVRTAYKSPAQREELLKWARDEFEAHKSETDPSQIRFLVAEGLQRARQVAKMTSGASS